MLSGGFLRHRAQRALLAREVTQRRERNDRYQEVQTCFDAGQQRGRVAAQAHANGAHPRVAARQQPTNQVLQVEQRLSKALDVEARICTRKLRHGAVPNAHPRAVKGQREQHHVEARAFQLAQRPDALLERERPRHVAVNQDDGRARWAASKAARHGQRVLARRGVTLRDLWIEQGEVAVPRQVGHAAAATATAHEAFARRNTRGSAKNRPAARRKSALRAAPAADAVSMRPRPAPAGAMRVSGHGASRHEVDGGCRRAQHLSVSERINAPRALPGEHVIAHSRYRSRPTL